MYVFINLHCAESMCLYHGIRQNCNIIFVFHSILALRQVFTSDLGVLPGLWEIEHIW